MLGAKCSKCCDGKKKKCPNCINECEKCNEAHDPRECVTTLVLATSGSALETIEDDDKWTFCFANYCPYVINGTTEYDASLFVSVPKEAANFTGVPGTSPPCFCQTPAILFDVTTFASTNPPEEMIFDDTQKKVVPEYSAQSFVETTASVQVDLQPLLDNLRALYLSLGEFGSECLAQLPETIDPVTIEVTALTECNRPITCGALCLAPDATRPAGCCEENVPGDPGGGPAGSSYFIPGGSCQECPPPCGSVFCYAGETCCNEVCCTVEQVCCGGVCCNTVCCNGVCCAPGQACCNGQCVTSPAFNCSGEASALSITLFRAASSGQAMNDVTVTCPEIDEEIILPIGAACSFEISRVFNAAVEAGPLAGCNPSRLVSETSVNVFGTGLCCACPSPCPQSPSVTASQVMSTRDAALGDIVRFAAQKVLSWAGGQLVPCANAAASVTTNTQWSVGNTAGANCTSQQTAVCPPVTVNISFA